MGLFEFIAKSRSGVYQNTAENRRLHRVGQRYGVTQQIVDEGELVPGMPKSTKVNLKKYLSDKMRKRVDIYINGLKITPTWNDVEKLNAAIRSYQETFNERFDAMPKSERAFYVETVKRLQSRVAELGNAKKPDNAVTANAEKSKFEQVAEKAGFKRGEPMPIDLADDKHANPKYGELVDGSFRPYTCNCQTCVVAYELRRRGYDVEAMGVNPRSGGLAGYINEFQHSIALNPINSFWGTSFNRFILNEDNSIKSNTPKGRSQFVANLFYATKGEGRYFLSMKNRRRSTGHIVVVESTEGGGKLLIDPQSGKRVDLTDAVAADKYFSGIDVKHPYNKVFRVDNLEFNPSVLTVMINKNSK